MLAHMPLGQAPLSTLASVAVATDATIVIAAFENDDAFDFRTAEAIASETMVAAPFDDVPSVPGDDFIIAAWFDELELVPTSDETAAFDAWVASPFEDIADAPPPPPPPQPGPLSALGGAGWFAEVPPSRRKKQKPTWPNLPAQVAGVERSWQLVTVTRETARLRIHRSAKAMHAKLKRETSLEDHVIAGIVAALIADQDKDD